LNLWVDEATRVEDVEACSRHLLTHAVELCSQRR
jgi:hypothetical protein